MRLEAVSLTPPSVVTQLDYIALGQHYGLKTRLLDWTTNPLVAAWFACSSMHEGDVYVYGLDITGMRHVPAGLNEVFSESEVTLFQPKHFDPRITAQQGWFTVHPYSLASNSFVPLEEDPKFSGSLVEFYIPSESRCEFLKSLQRHGVGSRSLFPGLEGLCKSFNQIQLVEG